MEMSGEYRISASREVVWGALNEPEVLKACLEGCEKFDKISDSGFEAIVTTKVGPIKTTFDCTLQLSDIDPPKAYTLSGEGDGGASGFAKGSVSVLLSESEGITVLNYDVDASLRGKIGQMGSRVIDSVAKMMADDFFDNLTRIVHERSGVSTEFPPPRKRLQSFIRRGIVIAVIVAIVIVGIVVLLT